MRPTKVEKKLLEELVPICKYVQASYKPGRYISVRWVDGNQQFDAEIVQRGEYVSHNCYPAEGYLEVVGAVHPKDYLLREALERNGRAFGLDGLERLKESGEVASSPVGYNIREVIASDSTRILQQIIKKTLKPYPQNTTLIVDCTASTMYSPDEWAQLVAQVKDGLPHFPFLEIYLYEHHRQHSHTFFAV
jgi:hypothetical protein